MISVGNCWGCGDLCVEVWGEMGLFGVNGYRGGFCWGYSIRWISRWKVGKVWEKAWGNGD